MRSSQNNVPLVIACDESGNDGENNLYGGNPIFAHASVAISHDIADYIMHEIRNMTGSKSDELKSKTLLNPKNRKVALWLLDHPEITTSASVHLTHKEFFLVSKLFDSTVEEMANSMGIDLYENGGALAGANIVFFLAPQAYGDEWDQLLDSFQLFLRSKTPSDAQKQLAETSRRLQILLSYADEPVRDFIGNIFIGIEHLRSLSDLQLGRGIEYRLRTADPLIAGIGATAYTWAARHQGPISIVHDEAKELSPARIESIKYSLRNPELVAASKAGTGIELVDVALVDSKTDTRVQVADLLAGLGRRIFEDIMQGTKNPLYEKFRPYVSDLSIIPNPDLMSIDTAREVMQNRNKT